MLFCNGAVPKAGGPWCGLGPAVIRPFGGGESEPVQNDAAAAECPESEVLVVGVGKAQRLASGTQTIPDCCVLWSSVNEACPHAACGHASFQGHDVNRLLLQDVMQMDPVA